MLHYVRRDMSEDRPATTIQATIRAAKILVLPLVCPGTSGIIAILLEIVFLGAETARCMAPRRVILVF